jgi:hypothetical protein
MLTLFTVQNGLQILYSQFCASQNQIMKRWCVPEVGVNVDVVLKNSYITTSYSAFEQLNARSEVTFDNVTCFDVAFVRNSNNIFYSK